MTTALVTGASTGLGRELAGLFASDGIDVVVVSSERSVSQLGALADELRSRHGVRVDTVTMDLSAVGAGAELVARVDDLGVDIEYLVNNAGVGILGLKIQESDPVAVSKMVQLNVVTLTDLTTRYAARMVQTGHGAILNISSIAAYVIPHGLEAGYSASKAFVRSFSERWPPICTAPASPVPTSPRVRSAPSSRRPPASATGHAWVASRWRPRRWPGPGTTRCGRAESR